MSTPPSRPSQDRSIADAASLFEDRPQEGDNDRKEREPVVTGKVEPTEETYDLSEQSGEQVVPGLDTGQDPFFLDDERVDSGQTRSTSSRPTPQFGQPEGASDQVGQVAERPRRPDGSRPVVKRESPDARSSVSYAWSRSAEWGWQLARLSVVALIIVGLGYLCYQIGFGAGISLVLGLGVPILILLSYPILITLETPVRVTPEQVLRNYYESLEHHKPHYRRMWNLLSDRGRISRHFSSYGEFQSYWQRKLVTLRRTAKVSQMNPLAFGIDDVKSSRSADRETAEVQFLLTIQPRRGSQKPLLALLEGSLTVVKGPDGSFYLNDGLLPEAIPSAKTQRTEED